MEGNENHNNWPRTSTSLTYYVKRANSTHGDIKQYEVFVVYYGKNDPEKVRNRRATNPSSEQIEGSWQQTRMPVQNFPIIYKDQNLTENIASDMLEIVIGENGRPLQPGSFYQIFLRAYTTVRLSTLFPFIVFVQQTCSNH